MKPCWPSWLARRLGRVVRKPEISTGVSIQFGCSLVYRSFMVRGDTAIHGAEGQLPVARPWNDLFVSQPADRREEKSKEPCWPPPGQSLDNTDNSNENTTCTVQRTTATEWS